MNNDQIIQKIKEENLKPISKSIFILRKVVVWFLLIMATLFGAYTFAFLFLKLLYIDFDNWFYLADSYDHFLIENLPLIWIILFVFSITSIFILFKKTGRGYKHSILMIALTSILISFILGIFLSKVLISRNLLIERFEQERMMKWTNPNEGRISGEMIFMDNDYMLIRDIRDDLWNVDIQYILDDSRQVIENDQLISIIGRPGEGNNFVACQILPLDMNKDHFRPNSKGFSYKNIDNFIENKINKDICDFVIKQW